MDAFIWKGSFKGALKGTIKGSLLGHALRGLGPRVAWPVRHFLTWPWCGVAKPSETNNAACQRTWRVFSLSCAVYSHEPRHYC